MTHTIFIPLFVYLLTLWFAGGLGKHNTTDLKGCIFKHTFIYSFSYIYLGIVSLADTFFEVIKYYFSDINTKGEFYFLIFQKYILTKELMFENAKSKHSRIFFLNNKSKIYIYHMSRAKALTLA